MSVHYSDSTVTVHHGDCLEVMAGMPDEFESMHIEAARAALTAAKEATR